jgi:hypothetical protein
LLGFSLGDPWGVGIGVAAVWVMIGGLISGAWLVLLALSSFITVTGHRANIFSEKKKKKKFNVLV